MSLDDIIMTNTGPKSLKSNMYGQNIKTYQKDVKNVRVESNRTERHFMSKNQTGLYTNHKSSYLQKRYEFSKKLIGFNPEQEENLSPVHHQIHSTSSTPNLQFSIFNEQATKINFRKRLRHQPSKIHGSIPSLTLASHPSPSIHFGQQSISLPRIQEMTTPTMYADQLMIHPAEYSKITTVNPSFKSGMILSKNRGIHRFQAPRYPHRSVTVSKNQLHPISAANSTLSARFSSVADRQLKTLSNKAYL